MTDLLADRGGNIPFVDKFLKAVPRKFNTFPSLAEVNEYLDEFRVKNTYYVADKPWISEVCPGTPAIIDWLCCCIRDQKTDMRSWQIGLACTGFSAIEMWDIFDEWIMKRMHPLVKNWKGLNGNIISLALQAARNLNSSPVLESPALSPPMGESLVQMQLSLSTDLRAVSQKGQSVSPGSLFQSE